MLTLCKHSGALATVAPALQVQPTWRGHDQTPGLARLAIAGAGVACGLFTLALAERADRASLAGRQVLAEVTTPPNWFPLIEATCCSGPSDPGRFAHRAWENADSGKS